MILATLLKFGASQPTLIFKTCEPQLLAVVPLKSAFQFTCYYLEPLSICKSTKFVYTRTEESFRSHTSFVSNHDAHLIMPGHKLDLKPNTGMEIALADVQ